MADLEAIVFKADTSDLKEAEKDLNKVNEAGKKTAKGVSNLGNTFSKNNHKIQNVSFQLQDMVTQLEMGTSVSRTMGQQLPQLLGAFGALGAVAGVVAGLGFTLGGPLLNGLFDSTEGAERLEGALESLSNVVRINSKGVVEFTDDIKNLSKASKDLADLQLQIAFNQAQIAIKEAGSQIAQELDEVISKVTAVEKLLDAGIVPKAAISRVEDLADELGLTNEEMRTFGELAKNLAEDATVDNIAAFSQFAKTLDLSNDELRDLVSNVNNSVVSMTESKAALDALNGALERNGQLTKDLADDPFYSGELDPFGGEKAFADNFTKTLDSAFQQGFRRTQGYLSRTNQTFRESYNERLEIIGEAESRQTITESQAAELRAKNDEIYNKQRVSSLSGTLGDISKLTSSNNKKLFNIGKAAAVAQATIDGISAVQRALASAPPPFNFALAGLVGAATAANVANIASSQPPNRALGGQVRAGESYRVGEFGPETLVMGSNGGHIVPNQSANDSTPINVQTNVQIVGGSPEATAETSVTQVGDKSFVVSVIVDEMSRQTSQSRQALQNTSNVLPRGGR